MSRVLAGLCALMLLVTVAAASATLTSTNPVLAKNAANTATMSVQLTNTGTTAEQGLIELAFFPQTFSFVSNQKACNPSFPWNVHKTYYLSPGESRTISLTATNIPPGTYKAVVTHVTTCCTDGVNNYDCKPKTPFGFESAIDVMVFGDPNANVKDQCDTDSQAGTYLMNKGKLDCSVPKCNDASSASSVASCSQTGECNTGANQDVSCSDGSLVTVRSCNSATWQETGNKCPGSSTIPDEPKGGQFNYGKVALLLGCVVLVGAGAKKVFGRKRS